MLKRFSYRTFVPLVPSVPQVHFRILILLPESFMRILNVINLYLYLFIASFCASITNAQGLSRPYEEDKSVTTLTWIIAHTGFEVRTALSTVQPSTLLVRRYCSDGTVPSVPGYPSQQYIATYG